MRLARIAAVALLSIVTIFAVACGSSSTSNSTATPTYTVAPTTTPTPTAIPTLSLSFETYTDMQLGFSILVPDSWGTYTGVSYSGNDDLRFFISSSECAEISPHVGVTTSSATPYTSVQTYYSEVVKPTKEDLDEYELISEENLTIDGVSAIKVLYTYDYYGVAWLDMDCYLIKHQAIWNIKGACAPDCWAIYEGTFNTMLNSFHVRN